MRWRAARAPRPGSAVTPARPGMSLSTGELDDVPARLRRPKRRASSRGPVRAALERRRRGDAARSRSCRFTEELARLGPFGVGQPRAAVRAGGRDAAGDAAGGQGPPAADARPRRRDRRGDRVRLRRAPIRARGRASTWSRRPSSTTSAACRGPASRSADWRRYLRAASTSTRVKWPLRIDQSGSDPSDKLCRAPCRPTP